jgi:aryl-alcohol dehydrogenase-like predicted oxidoreductase
VTRYGDTVVAIPGASRPEQAAAAAAAMDVHLTQLEMDSIDATSAAIAKR